MIGNLVLRWEFILISRNYWLIWLRQNTTTIYWIPVNLILIAMISCWHFYPFLSDIAEGRGAMYGEKEMEKDKVWERSNHALSLNLFFDVLVFDIPLYIISFNWNHLARAVMRNQHLWHPTFDYTNFTLLLA